MYTSLSSKSLQAFLAMQQELTASLSLVENWR